MSKVRYPRFGDKSVTFAFPTGGSGVCCSCSNRLYPGDIVVIKEVWESAVVSVEVYLCEGCSRAKPQPKSLLDNLFDDGPAKDPIMACGHPRAAIASSDEGTNYCTGCEAAAASKGAA